MPGSAATPMERTWIGGGTWRLRREVLGGCAGLGHIAPMSRPILALLVGLVGFAAYVGVVVLLADWVLTLHWLVQLAYFLVAGLAWRGIRGYPRADEPRPDEH